MSEQHLLALLKALIFPPGSLLALLMLALLLVAAKRRRAAIAALSLVLVAGYGLSTNAGAERLAGLAEAGVVALAPDALARLDADAIVILGANSRSNAAEYGGRAPSGLTLERLRYGAFLHRRTGLPLLVTGGRVFGGDGPAEADVMAASLREDFGVPVALLETESRNSYENASLSAALLADAGLNHVLLVSHANHLVRAGRAFESVGLTVTLAPTVFHGPKAGAPLTLLDFLPHAGALRVSVHALHELLGRAWYRLRYGVG